MKHLNNTVIKVLTREHGAKVIEWWKQQGVETDLKGSVNEEDDCSIIYYGFINYNFDNYSLKDVQEANAKIIELPTEEEIPMLGKGVLMEVSDYENFRASCERFVCAKTKKWFIAWQEAETEDEIDYDLISRWQYARPIQPIPEYTMEELVAKLGNFKIKK